MVLNTENIKEFKSMKWKIFGRFLHDLIFAIGITTILFIGVILYLYFFGGLDETIEHTFNVIVQCKKSI